MGKNAKRIWNAVVGAVQFWGVVGFIDAWSSGDAVVLGTYLVSTSLAMQTYAAISVGAGIFLLLWNKEYYDQWRQKRRTQRPEAKFRRLHKAVIREFNLIEQDSQFANSLARSPASKFAQRGVLRFALLECGVGTPDPSDSDQVWYEYVTNLTPLTMQGRLDEAKGMFG